MRISLKRKIWLTVFSVVLVFTGLLMYIIPTQQEKYIIQNHEKEVKNLTATVALGVRIALEEQNFEGIQTAMAFAHSEPRLAFVAMTQIDSSKTTNGQNFHEEIINTYPDSAQVSITVASTDSMIVKSTAFSSNLMNGRIIAGFTTEEVQQNMARIRLLSIGVSIAVLVFGVVLGLWLGNTISIPINHVKDAAIGVGQGDLTRKVAKRSNDEIGDLSEAFNKMVDDLSLARRQLESERQKSENLLLNILPEQTAHELKAKGKAQPRFYDQVTVLFTDFVGFTEMSAAMSPQYLVQKLDGFFSHFDEIMLRYGLEKIKTIGDAYMAVSGLHYANEKAVVNAVQAALDMQEYINNIPDKPKFTMRCGLHTGPVITGVVGLKKFQYDVWGDTVNTASRMESHGQKGLVNISENTYALIKNYPQFTFTERGAIQVKGKNALNMYYVHKSVNNS